MELAARIGININEFWDITPFELNIYATAYAERLKAETEINYNNNIINAYLTSRWVWQKRINIKKYLHTSEAKKDMSDTEMLLKVKALNAMMGGAEQRS